MRRLFLCTAGAIAFAAACSRGEPESKSGTAATPAAAPAKAPHADDAGVVRIEEGMLRDLRVTTAQVESRKGGEQVALLGELAVDQQRYAEVTTPMPARVSQLMAAPGDAVRVGQPLLVLQSADLGRARAEYLSSSARLRLAEAALKRKRDLLDERIVPLREVQEAEAEMESARAAVRSAHAALAAFDVDPPIVELTSAASTFTLRSPVAGTVIARNVMLGQIVDPASPALKIGDLSRLWLTVHAFERDAVRIRKGAPARLAFSALPGKPFDGVVALIGREVEDESRTVPVRIDVRNPGGVLRPGMSATAQVPVGESGAAILTVPVAAVQRVKGEWCVFIPKDATTFEVRKIGRGRDLGTEIEVLSGLGPKDIVVVEGAFLLKAQAEKGEPGHGGHG
jgi:cobalt-zinc-cadmium efflux system membrane fusion protein